MKRVSLADVSHRIIIFSLFGRTLEQIARRLSRLGVRCVTCRGNVHSRKRAMAAFQEDGEAVGERVILLSLENAASGANLKRASHVILVDPVPGSSSESFAAERQAVGRAVRQGMADEGEDEEGAVKTTQVIRLVVAGSIEEETHRRNEEIRKESQMDEEMAGGVGHKSNLKKSLRIERRNSEIEFYCNIKQRPEVEVGDDIQMKEKGKEQEEEEQGEQKVVHNKRRRRRKRTRSERKEEEMDDAEPPNKKMKIDEDSE